MHFLRFAKFLIYICVAHPLVGVLVVVGVLAAFVCAGIAAHKGRSSLGWGILGFFFSIVTLIVLLTITSKTPPEPESSPGGARVI